MAVEGGLNALCPEFRVGVQGEQCDSIRATADASPPTFSHVHKLVILPQAVSDAWLNPNDQDVERLQALLRPYPAEEMEGYPSVPK